MEENDEYNFKKLELRISEDLLRLGFDTIQINAYGLSVELNEVKGEMVVVTLKAVCGQKWGEPSKF